MGEVVVGIAAVAVLAWLGILINASRARARRRAEETPLNLQPGMTDDDIETKRLDKVLIAALVSSAVLAVVLPIYYLSEADRQADAAEGFHERDVEEGEHFFSTFSCINCHGAGAVGGTTSFVEPRSNLETLWAVPSLNDIFFRYDEDEVRYWIVFGRAGSPMPANGLEGGGAMTSQEVDQVIAYLRSIQVSQTEAFESTDSKVDLALRAMESADETVAGLLTTQRDERSAIVSAPARFEAAAVIPVQFESILTGDGSCTSETAELLGAPCKREGIDSDRDSVSDVAELALNELFATATSVLADARFDITLDPASGFSTSAGGEPVADLQAIRVAQTRLNTVMLNLEVTAVNAADFLARAEAGIAFLEDAASSRRYAIDLNDLADRAFEGDVDKARRAAGLYNAFCARCHTAGYSAGAAYTQEAGSGAIGPSLVGGRAIVQFPDPEDHLDFIHNGSENAKPYGLNGVGRGWMPGFGFVLSETDLRLIVDFERAL